MEAIAISVFKILLFKMTFYTITFHSYVIVKGQDFCQLFCSTKIWGKVQNELHIATLNPNTYMLSITAFIHKGTLVIYGNGEQKMFNNATLTFTKKAK